MSIGTPQVVLKLVDTSVTNLGTTGAQVVNSGTLGADYTVFGTGTTRSASNGLWTGSGKLLGSSNTTGVQTYMTTTGGTAPGTALRCISVATAFKITAISDSSAKIAMPNGSTSDGNIRLTCDTPPTASGNFDLNIDFRHSGGAGTNVMNFPNLTFGTVYQVACSIDMTTSGAVQPRGKLNSGSVNTPATSNFTSFGMENAYPRLLHRVDFPGTGAFGFQGELYYFAMLCDATNFWNATDLASINTDPTILWSAGGGSTIKTLGLLGVG